MQICTIFGPIMPYKSVQKFVPRSVQCMVANFQSQLTLTHTHTRTLTLYCTNFFYLGLKKCMCTEICMCQAICTVYSGIGIGPW